LSEHHSVNSNNERNNQQNIAIENDEEEKHSSVKGKKPIVEEESEAIATETVEKALHDEPNFGKGFKFLFQNNPKKSNYQTYF
jgi:hypothetical protein